MLPGKLTNRSFYEVDTHVNWHILSHPLQAQPTMFVILVFMMVRETLKHGISASAIDAFVSYGVILW